MISCLVSFARDSQIVCLVPIKQIEEPEEKSIAKIGLTYGVLRRLGFSELRVEECLRAIQGVDLDEAFEWVRFTSVRISSASLVHASYTCIARKMN